MAIKKRLKFVITAGPTREFIDPVRFLSNPSTGKMGFAIAQAAAARGHDCVLIAGPVTLKTPRGVRRLDVVSARDMCKATAAEATGPDTVFIAVAAVADWRPKRRAANKLKKNEMSGILELTRNPDILKSIKGVKKIGFAAETRNLAKEAMRKCREKNLEMIVANDVSQKDAGFGTDSNRVIFLKKDGSSEKLPLMSKSSIAKRIIQFAEGLYT